MANNSATLLTATEYRRQVALELAIHALSILTTKPELTELPTVLCALAGKIDAYLSQPRREPQQP